MPQGLSLLVFLWEFDDKYGMINLQVNLWIFATRKEAKAGTPGKKSGSRKIWGLRDYE